MLKTIPGIAVAITSILSVVLLLMDEFNWAIFSITVMLTLTNAVRAKDMSNQGHDKEAAWMRKVSIFFGIASAAVLFVNLFM